MPAQDGYPIYTVFCYVVVFAVIASHVKKTSQVMRLLGAVVGMGTMVAGYGILQHYHMDYLNLSELTGGGSARITAFMGNSLFAGSVILMTLITTLTLALVYLTRLKGSSANKSQFITNWIRSSVCISFWGLVTAIQIMGLLFTYARGPWVSFVFSFAVILFCLVIAIGWKRASFLFIYLAITLSFVGSILLLKGSISIFALPQWTGWLSAVAAIGSGLVFIVWKQILLGLTNFKMFSIRLNRVVVILCSLGVFGIINLAVVFYSAFSDM